MKCVEISEFGGPEVLKLVERDKPTAAAGEVLVEVHAAGVNRPDCVQRMGMYPAPPGDSDLPGLEIAGVIEAVGEGVDASRIGERVCALVGGGGYANYCVAPVETLLPVPDGLDMATAAAIPETYFTVWSNLFDRAALRAGEWLLVHGGSSGIGSTAIQMAKAFGAQVITTVGNAEKAAFCEGLGADHVVNYREADFVEAVKEVTDGSGVNVVLDMVGGDYLPRNISCMAVDGRHVTIAFLRGPKAEVNLVPVMLKRLVLTGSTLRARDRAFKGAIAAALHEHVWPLMETGKARPLLYQTFPLAQAAEAHKLMESSGHMGKIVLLTGASE